MKHWTESTIKGAEECKDRFNLSDLFLQAYTKGRYNDSNWIKSWMMQSIDSDNPQRLRIPLNMSTKKMMLLVVKLSKSASGVLGDYTLELRKVTNDAPYTQTHTRGKSTTGKYAKDNLDGQSLFINWSYDIVEITGGADLTTDKVPNERKVNAMVYSGTDEGKAVVKFFGENVYIKFIEIADGFDNIAIPKPNEIIPSNFYTAFYGMIKSSFIGYEETLLKPRLGNYIIPVSYPEYDDTNVGLSPYISLSEDLFLSKIIRSIKSKKNSSTDNYSNVETSQNYYPTESSGKIKGLNVRYFYSPNSNRKTEKKQQYVLAESGYTYFRNIVNACFDEDFSSVNQLVDFYFSQVYPDYTECLLIGYKNQFSGYAETSKQDLYEFYSTAVSGTSTSRKPIDNIRLSIIINTLSLPFWSFNNDCVDCNDDIKGKGNVSIYPFPISVRFGFATTGQVSSDWDIFDETNNVYIRFVN